MNDEMNFTKCHYGRLIWYSICIFLVLVFSSCSLSEKEESACKSEKIVCQEEAPASASIELQAEVGGKETLSPQVSSEQPADIVFEEKTSASAGIEQQAEVGGKETLPPQVSSEQPTDIVCEEKASASAGIEQQAEAESNAGTPSNTNSKKSADIGSEKSELFYKKIESDLIEEYKKQLSSAHIAFNNPQKMEKDETTIVKLLLSHSLPLEDLRKKVEETISRSYLDNQKQKITTERIKVDTLIAVDLSGSEGFMIRTMGKHDQRAISKTSTEEWRWEVKAVEVGVQYLFLEISAIMKLRGEDKYLQLITFDRKIDVYISAPSVIANFFSKYWQWFLTVIVIPLTLAAGQKVVNWIKKRKKYKNERPIIQIP